MSEKTTLLHQTRKQMRRLVLSTIAAVIFAVFVVPHLLIMGGLHEMLAGFGGFGLAFLIFVVALVRGRALSHALLDEGYATMVASREDKGK